MNKINFTNLPSTTTPVNASNLNLLQDNVDNGKQDKIIQGVWTPQLTNTGGDGEPSVTYDYQIGDYFKIGKMIVCLFRFRGKITALGGSNYAGIKGFPYNLGTNLVMASFSSVYNLLTNYGGGEMKSVPTMVAQGNNKVQIQSGDALGASASQFKLSGNESFECFGGVIYISE